MDIWGMLFAGREWTDDDGGIHSQIWAGEQFKVTVATKTPDPRTPKFKVQWATMTAEILRSVDEQLTTMRNHIIHRARFDENWRDYEEG